MALWDDLIADIYTLTSRSDLVAETAIALRQAVRIAHKSGKYWRDLVSVTVAPTVQQVQQIDLTVSTARFRQVASLRSGYIENLWYSPVTIDDILDADGYARTDVYWGFGTLINVRARSPEDSLILSYYQYPLMTPTASFNSWIADQHFDLLSTLAASIVLSLVGESEIKSKMDQLAAIMIADLQQDNLEIVGR